jgi:aconitate hydratase
LAEDRPLQAILHQSDGSTQPFDVAHSLNDDQIAWFKAGSALNVLKS